jgi:hydroxylamine dehydrogenase
MPTPKVCGECHAVQHDAFQSEKQYGFPSHVLAMERATDSKHFADKPKAETTACVQCHSVATKCDSCHTRHRFEAAEARRAEACTTCHSGPPHPDDETFTARPTASATSPTPRRPTGASRCEGQLH